MFCKRLIRDSDGSTLVEVTVMMSIFFVFLLGAVDFLFAFYQWNMAAKAVEIGARIAAVSDPVASGLNASTISGSPGGTLPTFSVVCNSSAADGSSGSCVCTGTCTGIGSYSSTAMQPIIFGRGSSNPSWPNACLDGNSYYNIGMCDIFSGIDATKVTITYASTGMGFAGRPGGVVPTITVQVRNMPFTYFFLGSLLNFLNVNMPPLTTTITGEDLCSSNSCS
jgi:Flp pilus assembly protein TadG